MSNAIPSVLCNSTHSEHNQNDPFQYTRDHEDDIVDIEEQTNRVTEEEVNLLHYRRRGNKLVRRFLHLLSHKGRRTPLTKEETLISNVKFLNVIFVELCKINIFKI